MEDSGEGKEESKYFVEVKEPEIWYPGQNTDEYYWDEEGAYNSRVFWNVVSWLNANDFTYSFEDKEVRDLFFENMKVEPARWEYSRWDRCKRWMARKFKGK